jgi:hypothetical protein
MSGGVVLEQERPPARPLPPAGEPDGEPGDVAFVVSHSYVDALACFREPIKHLAERGWRVDLYTVLAPTHAAPNFQRENVRLRPISVTRWGAVRLLFQLLTRRPRYRAIFTVPQWSLRMARLAATVRKIPVVYISDEIIVESELRTDGERARKRRERRDHRSCAATIALTPERAACIREENGVPASQPTFIVPNSAPGPAVRLRSRYYQDVLDIPDDAFILLHAGGLNWPPALELAERASRWTDPGLVLVYQGRLRGHMVGRVDSPSVRFNPVVLPADLLDYATSSAHIGLALYPEQKTNDRLMSVASGKLCLYLKNGLPVITTRQRCFDWVERSGCGLPVSHPDEVLDAAREIRRHYDRFAAAARRYYDAHLDFGRNFAPVEAALLDGALGRREGARG